MLTNKQNLFSNLNPAKLQFSGDRAGIYMVTGRGRIGRRILGGVEGRNVIRQNCDSTKAMYNYMRDEYFLSNDMYLHVWESWLTEGEVIEPPGRTRLIQREHRNL